MNDEIKKLFPTYKVERDIALQEYQLTANSLSGDDKAFAWASNSAILIASVIGFFAFRVSEFLSGLEANSVDVQQVGTGMIIMLLLFSIVSCGHLANIIKSRALSERKIVVIRRMLGVSYGDSNLVLPNWRIEGADNPFALKLFPGYFSYRSSSLHIVLVSVSISVLLLWNASILGDVDALLGFVGFSPIIFIILWYLVILLFYKRLLREAHENIFLSLARILSVLLRVPLAKNFEYSLYLAKLDVEEAKRIAADFSEIEKIAIQVEDQQFLDHRGINLRGTARALFGKLRGKNLGGGSSITQQFVRSNFIFRLRPVFRRKIIEVILAFWAEVALSKSEILKLYLCTVRYDLGVYGFHRSYGHFFLDNPSEISKAEAFFLIERLANTKQKFLGRRVLAILNRLLDAGAMNISDCRVSLGLYAGFIGHHFEVAEHDLHPNQVLLELEKRL